ncbi:hypothetical protein ACJRO7_007653 [Eucalyptus globulus]|uniref:MATH domain-containing protein n=1 Tax=Eucalyptus globulus TaxID=34317 RepID=A0ABD3ILU6_EUCGL
MSARRGRFSRWGFSSRPPRNTAQNQHVDVPLSPEPELIPRFEERWMFISFFSITNFTSLTREVLLRNVHGQRQRLVIIEFSFRQARIVIFPKGNHTDHLSIHLDVADSKRLPYEWSRNAHFKLILVCQNDYGYSSIKETEHIFTARESDWGIASFHPLHQVHHGYNGYLVNNTLMVATPTATFDVYFINLEEIINTAQSSPARGVLKTSNQKGALLTSEAPTVEELNVKDRLAEAVSTLSIAKSGLTLDQQNQWRPFGPTSMNSLLTFLTFKQDNAEFKRPKLLKDQMLATMKRNHETHILYKQFLGDLTIEEEELIKKLEEVKSRREKLISEWEILMVQSEEAQSGYMDQEKKVVQAEEKKRIAEERMSRSTTPWSNLKTLFG